MGQLQQWQGGHGETQPSTRLYYPVTQVQASLPPADSAGGSDQQGDQGPVLVNVAGLHNMKWKCHMSAPVQRRQCLRLCVLFVCVTSVWLPSLLSHFLTRGNQEDLTLAVRSEPSSAAATFYEHIWGLRPFLPSFWIFTMPLFRHLSNVPMMANPLKKFQIHFITNETKCNKCSPLKWCGIKLKSKLLPVRCSVSRWFLRTAWAD